MLLKHDVAHVSKAAFNKKAPGRTETIYVVNLPEAKPGLGKVG